MEKCPHCGYEFDESWTKAIGKAVLLAGAVIGGTMLGGPIGAAAGGGIVGSILQRGTNKAIKDSAKHITYRCPRCGKTLF